MTELKRRDALFGGSLMLLAGASILLRPRRAFPRLPESVLGKAIPFRVGNYMADASGDFILPPTDSLSSKLYDKVLTRLFVAQGKAPVMLLVAYGSVQNLTLELHRPEECYPMTGFTISSPVTVPLNLVGHKIPAAFLTACRADRTEQILYWSRVGHRFPQDRQSQTLMVAQENLSGRMPDGVLLRASIISEDAADALRQLLRFFVQLGPALPPLGRRILLG